MSENFRIIDANINRLSEALRVIEEIARFNLNNEKYTSLLKGIRHKVNNSFAPYYTKLLEARDSSGDIGPSIQNISDRTSVVDLFNANCKRAQQAIRVLEEYTRLDFPELSPFFESFRYQIYSLEKNMSKDILDIYRKKRLATCKLYLVTDRSGFDNTDKFYDAIASAIKGGVDIVQLREKNATAREFIQLARMVKQICAEYNVIFIINDRVDIALAVSSDGVHLGQDDMDLQTARHILGPEAIIGSSTHKPDDAINAMHNGADYLGVGPVFATPTKPGRQAVGLDYVSWAASNVKMPFFAIGGINEDNVHTVVNAGAKRVAVVRAIMNSTNPGSAASNILNQLSKESSLI